MGAGNIAWLRPERLRRRLFPHLLFFFLITATTVTQGSVFYKWENSLKSKLYYTFSLVVLFGRKFKPSSSRPCFRLVAFRPDGSPAEPPLLWVPRLYFSCRRPNPLVSAKSRSHDQREVRGAGFSTKLKFHTGRFQPLTPAMYHYREGTRFCISSIDKYLV